MTQLDDTNHVDVAVLVLQLLTTASAQCLRLSERFFHKVNLYTAHSKGNH